MNFKINNLHFGAQYTVYGKQSAQETNLVYGEKIKKLKLNRALATEAQGYLSSSKMQEKISELPKDTFVRLHTGILSRENKEDEFLNFTPFLSFETRKINEQAQLKKVCGDGADILKLSLNDKGGLDKAEINSWFDNLLDYYS